MVGGRCENIRLITMFIKNTWTPSIQTLNRKGDVNRRVTRTWRCYRYRSFLKTLLTLILFEVENVQFSYYSSLPSCPSTSFQKVDGTEIVQLRR